VLREIDGIVTAASPGAGRFGRNGLGSPALVAIVARE
jgi:hypothetical protein